MKYKIDKYNFWNIKPERFEFLDKNYLSIYFLNNLQKYSDKNYLYWDDIKFKKLPKELENNEELRYIIKKVRFLFPTIVKSESWEYFWIWKLNFLEELLHNLDLSLEWNFLWINFNKKERREFLQNWIIEEAISSSQLEWAMTTSKKAKEMIKTNRKPIWNDEKMILNNYKVMVYINNDLIKEKLSAENLLKLQSILTKDILEEEKIWRFRTDEDEIVIQDNITWEIYHRTPNQNFLMQEIEKFFIYANDEEKTNSFTHPFIKACILHFWIWYLHPFCDGNWRTARAIFYWYLLKKWYWGFSYIPLSRIIKETKNKYENAYLYSEQDNFDLSYFIVYITNITKQAIEEFKNYISKKIEKQKNIDYIDWLNERQNRLLNWFKEFKYKFVNNSTHKNYYWISINTAKSDLEDLVKKWFLEKKKEWKFVNYYFKKD